MTDRLLERKVDIAGGVTFYIRRGTNDKLYLRVEPYLRGLNLSLTDAIALSLVKWNILEMLAQQGILAHEGEGQTCALCGWSRGECSECPIGQLGKKHCEDSPYVHWRTAYAANDAHAAYQAATAEAALISGILQKHHAGYRDIADMSASELAAFGKDKAANEPEVLPRKREYYFLYWNEEGPFGCLKDRPTKTTEEIHEAIAKDLAVFLIRHVSQDAIRHLLGEAQRKRLQNIVYGREAYEQYPNNTN